VNRPGAIGATRRLPPTNPDAAASRQRFAPVLGAEAAQAFASSEELKDGIQRAGVQGEPEIWFVAPA
jgi:hypothetical protein